MAATINITLPEPLKAYVDAQITDGVFKSADEYISELIRADRDGHRRNLEERLLESLKDKDRAIEVPDEVWEHGDVVAFLESRAKQLD